jgi:hypothetical protein
MSTRTFATPAFEDFVKRCQKVADKLAVNLPSGMLSCIANQMPDEDALRSILMMLDISSDQSKAIFAGIPPNANLPNRMVYTDAFEVIYDKANATLTVEWSSLVECEEQEEQEAPARVLLNRLFNDDTLTGDQKEYLAQILGTSKDHICGTLRDWIINTERGEQHHDRIQLAIDVLSKKK